MTEQDIAQFSKGMYHVLDERDYAFGAVTIPPFDWSQILKPVVNLTANNQNGSLSCVGQTVEAMARIKHYLKYGTLKGFSARYIYSQIFLPNGGAFLRDGIATLVSQGIQLEAGFPSQPESEGHMRDQTGINKPQAIEDYGKGLLIPNEAYATIPLDISDMAAAIKEHGCIMIGVKGNNAEWTTADPTCNQATKWGHAICGVGAEIRKGKKAIKFLNSWGPSWGENGYGYLNENYFAMAGVIGAYVITDNFINPTMEILDKNPDKLVQDVQGSGAFGIIIDGKIRVATPNRDAELVLTYLMRGAKGTLPLDAATWAMAPKVNF